MGLLEKVCSPADVRALDPSELDQLAREIREFLVDAVSRTGGHLGPNLGVVELTIALHRVFESPRDRILLDTGHQAYVHKLLTGRSAGFARLRQRGGLSGYPSRAESEHDIIENSHASTALGYADGLAKAYELRGESHRAVVAVIGDGALTGGMAWEALNNIAAAKTRRVVIVVNDNGRSYSPTIGGLANHLAALRLNPRYEHALEFMKTAVPRVPLLGPSLYTAMHAAKVGLKDAFAPQPLFEDFGIKYFGPVDGHDEPAVERALRAAREFGGPVIVHCVTMKGRGYLPAEQDQDDCLHGPGAFDPATGVPLARRAASWTNVFAEELVSIGATRPDVVAITAAMLRPTGLAPFARAYPARVYDVGIAEQHAVTSAAGLALGGLHPVVALYATFLNRAFDQVLMDVALHRLPVTFVLDRAGITGNDGPSHNGMWDMSILQVVPGLRIAAPRDGTRLRELLREAVAVTDDPTAVRFAKGTVPPDMPAIGRNGGIDILVQSRGQAGGAAEGAAEVLIVGVGAMAQVCVEAATILTAHGIGVTVVDPRWVKPLDPALLDMARHHSLVVVAEDNVTVGGVGDAVARMLRPTGAPVRTFGVPARFLSHASRESILSEVGLDAQNLARQITEIITGRSAPLQAPAQCDTGRV